MTEDTQKNRAPILPWNVTDSSKCSDHYVNTASIQNKNSESQTTITKFNINKANWHLFTSNETWKEVTNPVRSQSAEALTKDLYKKIQLSAKLAIPMIGVKKNFLKP